MCVILPGTEPLCSGITKFIKETGRNVFERFRINANNVKTKGAFSRQKNGIFFKLFNPVVELCILIKRRCVDILYRYIYKRDKNIL